MKNLKKKALVMLLAISIVGSASVFTAYAEPDINTDNSDVVVDPGNGGDVIVDTPPSDNVVVPDVPDVPDDTPVTPPVDVPADPVDPGVSDVPSTDDNPSYDDGTGEYPPDVNNDTNQGDDSQNNYDPGYYDDTYNDGYYNSNDSYYDNSWITQDTYDPNMTFDEFERATDYYSATVATINPVDMYNSNGSTSSDTLTKDDWADITLNFDETSVNSSDDFGFIKNNDAASDSNLSILLLILGIVFVVLSLSIITYMIISKAKRGKTPAHLSSNRGNQTKRTKFVYDTPEIDVSQYADRYDNFGR